MVHPKTVSTYPAMTTTAWSNFTMPSGTSDDKQQQPKSSAFPSSNNYFPNTSIWGNSPAAYNNSHARGPSLNKDANENTAPSTAILPNSEPRNAWDPWTNESTQPTNTSPSRTRDNVLPKSSNGFNGVNGANGGGVYGSAFSSQKRASHETAYFESMTSSFPQSRDQSAPPSRQSQSSPAYQEFQNGRGHAQSNSIHSQRQPFLPYQAVNNRAFNLNKQVDEEISMGFNRRLTVDHTAGTTTNFDPNSQPFQLNPGSQTFGETNGLRYSNGTDAQIEPLATQFAALKRPSIDRVSPAPSYHLEPGNSPRTYTQTPDLWNSGSTSRDPRTADFERRPSAQQFQPAFINSFNPYQNQYPQLAPAQFNANPSYIDPYAQSYRHPMMTGFGLGQLPAGYSNLPPIRPSADLDPLRGLRSALLEEFRSNSKSNKRYELKDLYSYIVEFSGDQHGSRFIQSKLESANSDEKDQVFREVEPNAVQLMKDVFGNYVVQKFFEHGNQVQKKILGERMKGKMVELSVQVYACRVVQKALDHVLVEQQAELTKELATDILKVIMDQNGNHVIQRIVEMVPRKHLDFIMDALRGQVLTLSTHQYGCRVVQRMMEHGTEEDKAAIIKELHPSAQILLTDQFGNYVAQHVIKHGKPDDHSKMVKLVMEQLIDLCKHKYASNVVEACILKGSPELVTEIRERFTKAGSDGTVPLQQLMRDSFGNYVIQTMYNKLEGAEKDSFVEDIRPLVYLQKKNGNTKQVTSLERILDEHSTRSAKLGLGHAGNTASTDPTTSPRSDSPPSSVNSVEDKMKKTQSVDGSFQKA